LTTMQANVTRKPSKTIAAKPAVRQVKPLTAESVTTIAVDFLKRIGHKGGLKPRKATLQGDLYTVEIEFKNHVAVVKVQVATREIKEYEIQQKSEETGSTGFIERKQLILSFVIPIIIYVAFKFLGV